MEDVPVACIRQSSLCCPSDRLGCLSCNYFPARASGTNFASRPSLGRTTVSPTRMVSRASTTACRANLLAAIVIHWNPSISAKRSSSGNSLG